MRNASITVKIWLSIGVFVLGFVLSTLLGQVESLNTEHALRSAADALFPAAQEIQAADTAFQRAIKNFGDAVIVQDASGLDRAVQDGELSVHNLGTVVAIPNLPAQRRAQALALKSGVKQFIEDAHSTYSEIMKNPGSITLETQDNLQKLASRSSEIKTSLEQARQQSSADLRTQLSSSRSVSVTQRWVSLLVFAITIVVATLIVNMTIRRSIVSPITRVIYGVQEAASDASQASDEMANSGQAVAQEAQQQAAYLEETVASLEEISASTRQNATRAGDADKLMRNAGETVVRATQAMDDLTTSMSAISQSSIQVAAVLKNIEEIAFMTNILALNAAVEAARAGEAGAGFSVVADEVRSLAKRAADATSRSGQIIEKTMKDVSFGVQSLSTAQETFNQISSAVVENGRTISQIAASSQEQAVGVTHISEAITRIGAVTQNNVAHAHHTAQSASSMSQQILRTRQHLDELVAVVGLDKA